MEHDVSSDNAICLGNQDVLRLLSLVEERQPGLAGGSGGDLKAPCRGVDRRQCLVVARREPGLTSIMWSGSHAADVARLPIASGPCREFAGENLCRNRVLARPSGAIGDDAKRRLEVALRSGHMGTYSWDPVSGRGVYDEPLLELYGFAPGQFGGQLGRAQQTGAPGGPRGPDQRGPGRDVGARVNL